jgi:hypothetical protein
MYELTTNKQRINYEFTTKKYLSKNPPDLVKSKRSEKVLCKLHVD